MSMADRDGLIWFDGEMVAWRDATVHVLTHTLHYGMGCFEGVRAYHADQGTAIFALEAHTRRLLDSCKILGALRTQLVTCRFLRGRKHQRSLSGYPRISGYALNHSYL